MRPPNIGPPQLALVSSSDTRCSVLISETYYRLSSRLLEHYSVQSDVALHLS